MDEKLFQGLEYLHDCVLLEIKYDVTVPENRKLTLLLEAPEDLGYSAWNGQTLGFTASGIYFFHYVVWGNVKRSETLDRWDVGISEATQKELDRDAMGFSVPDMKFSVTFHSGSYLEFVCNELAVDVRTKE